MIYKRKTKAGKTRHVVKVYVGTDPGGKKLDKHVGTYGTRGEAVAAEAKALKLYGTESSDETISDFAARWLAHYPRARQSTMRKHEQAIKRFVQEHGKRAPQSLQRKEARAWALAWPSSHASLRAMWSDMSNENIVETNPFAGLRLPQSKGRAGITPPSGADLDRLKATALRLKPGPHGEEYAAMIDFAAHTGIRRGELCVLTWADLDFEAGRLAVNKTLSDDREVLPPKNGASREIALPPQAAEAVLRLARPLDPNALVFSTPNGRRYSKSTWHYHWNPVRVAAGMPTLDWHELRHYCATYMIGSLGLSPHLAAEQLGHSDGGELLMRLYAHPDQTETLDAILRAFRRAQTAPAPIEEARARALREEQR